MQVIKIHHPLNQNLIPEGQVVLAMGFFDGVHRGHQAVIKEAKQRAEKEGLPLAVLTYANAPVIVYKPFIGGFKYLSPAKRKCELLEQLGVDRVYLVDFTSAFAAQSPQEFVDTYLIGFHAKVVVAGFDHTYGPGPEATMANLPRYAKDRFSVITVPKMNIDGQKISSTRIRQFLDSGDVAKADHLLGYIYTTSGIVVHGEARGRTMGFPTANVEGPRESRLPAVGVYAVQLEVSGKWYDGVANIGYNVTFGENRPKTVEINLFDFDQMIYGEPVRVRWYAYLRGDVHFDGKASLVKQMTLDAKHARQILQRDGRPNAEKIQNP